MKLKVIEGGRTEITTADLFNPKLAHLQQNEHMKDYYRATRSFEKFWQGLQQKEAGR